MQIVHIHVPQPIFESCIVIDCPTCQRQRRAFCAYYEWYGATVICAGCGDEWHDGCMAERPFTPGWRQRQRDRAVRSLERIGAKA